MSDTMLIEAYVQSRSPAALEELARRHMDWVYSAALRMVGNADLAQDVTQAVFLVLVQKAALLERKPLNAWLFGVTRFAARHVLRDRSRRQRHERMAAIMMKHSGSTQNQEIWASIVPLLDELVARLSSADRRAILLRFYQAKSMAQVGAALGVSEDAAKKRVAKAVKRLRELLARRGVRVPADALGAILLERAAHCSPMKPAEIARTTIVAAASEAVAIAGGVIRMMAITKLKIAALVVVTIGLVPAAVALALLVPSTKPATMPTADAADLYAQAASSLTVDSPAATSVIYPNFPPSSPQWRAIEAVAWEADAKARQLVFQAKSVSAVNWPPTNDMNYYNPLRNLAIHIGDSAIYANMQGKDADAVEIIRDLNHMGHLLLNSPNQPLRVLVGVGVKFLAMYDMEIIASGVVVTKDSKNARDLQIQTAQDWIGQLLDQTELTGRLHEVPQWQATEQTRKWGIESLHRATAEQTMAAMSLACHLFKFDKGRWPNSLEELIPAYLPEAKVDPFGDGKQTIGYVLIKGGLPDGSDRPLVYDRANSSDGLYYLTNEIAFGYYITDGSNRSAQQQKHYGQFRDVTRWEPRKNFTGPTALPLPAQAERGPSDQNASSRDKTGTTPSNNE